MCVYVQSNLTRILVIENLSFSARTPATCVSAPGDDGRASSCRPLPGDGDSPAAGDGAHSQRAGDGLGGCRRSGRERRGQGDAQTNKYLFSLSMCFFFSRTVCTFIADISIMSVFVFNP